MVMDRANCGTEVNEAMQEDPLYFACEGKLANEGEKVASCAGILWVEIKDGSEEFHFPVSCNGSSCSY